MGLSKIKYWGASTSAHQVEGGNHNQWTVWELANANELAKTSPKRYGWLNNWEEISRDAQDPNNYVSNLAVDHFRLYEQDLDLAKKLNFNAFRFSIEWSRIEPEEGEWDESALDYYHNYINALKKRGLEPFMTLFHFTLPDWFAQKGGFLHAKNIKYFTRFVEKIMAELKDVIYITTINEPGVYSFMSYMDGKWPPQERSKLKTTAVMVNLVSAHKKAYKIIKRSNPNCQIGISKNYSYFYTHNNHIEEKITANILDYFSNVWFLSRIKKYQDFIGINFYFSNCISGIRRKNPNNKVNDLGWDMKPQNLYGTLMRLHVKYAKPIFITESGVADSKDVHRKWWIQQSLKAINKAILEGVEVGSYLHWSFIDNFEWADGFWPKFGLVEVDYRTLERKPRPSALWYRDFISKITSKDINK